ncbi:MAG: uroporphyrinogen-III C-methyltransferase [Hyphomicrobiales bacterium]|nr:uroporphyrinogen-III C-methyltransferase [Hyphomicrobiales bacterium]
MNTLPFDLPTFEPGWVWLAGAGPGDPGMLTLTAFHGLRSADVVVYDALVGNEILSLALPDTVLEYAGKRGGRPSPRQADISRRLIDLARNGKRVLRLKGGDPFVFGRGGEEALALVAAEIPFRIIPGVSSGTGGLAYAGIPVTHRTTNSVVTFLTGHNLTADVPGRIDWGAIARGSPVIVIYMGLKHLADIAARLIAAGRFADEPVAVVSQASLPGQQVVVTTLARCHEEAEAAGVAAPTLIVIGEVVRLRSGLDWLGALAGRVLDADPLRQRHDREAG